MSESRLLTPAVGLATALSHRSDLGIRSSDTEKDPGEYQKFFHAPIIDHGGLVLGHPWNDEQDRLHRLQVAFDGGRWGADPPFRYGVLMEPVYRPVIGLALGIFKTMGWRIRTFGAEMIPTAGPAVLASNHIGYLDFVFVGYAARAQGRLVRFMAKAEVFDHRVSGSLMRGMKHIPVDRYARASDSIDTAVEALRRDELVGMFPEGTISRSFVPRAGKTGAARMAMAAQAPLIPCATWGTQRILTKSRPKNFERKVAMDVYIGEPLAYEPDEDPGVVTSRLMDAIGVLVEKAQGNYPQEARSGEDWWLPAHLGGSAPTVAEADALDASDRARRKAERDAQP